MTRETQGKRKGDSMVGGSTMTEEKVNNAGEVQSVCMWEWDPPWRLVYEEKC